MPCTVVSSCDSFEHCISYGNGSSITCSDKHSLQCSASLTSDPDIAGWGVLIAFVATALFTVVVAWTQLLLGHPHFGNKRSGSNIYNANEKLLGSLCDLQIVTSSAILIAGFAQWSTISFYHESLIVNYWWLTLNSFWAARSTFGIPYGKRVQSSGTQTSPSAASISNSEIESAQPQPGVPVAKVSQDAQKETATPLTWRDKVRISCIICSLILFTVFQIHVARREYYHWDFLQSDYCYRYHDYSAYKSIWLWVAGVIMLATAFFLMLLDRTKRLIDKWDDYTKKARIYVYKWCEKTFWGILAQCTVRGNLVLVVKLLVMTLYLLLVSTLLAIYCCLLQFMAIFSYGNGYWPLEMVFLTAFAMWQTFDVLDLKLSNKVLLVGSETQWGFGQVLPLVLLSMICFNVMDAWEDQ